MKKLIGLILIMFAAFTYVDAQTATFIMPKESTYLPVTTDYTLTDAVAKWYLWKVEKDWIITHDFQINIDSTSGNHTNVAVGVYGRKFSNDSWTQIGSTVNWKGTTADTTITISNTTGARWREIKTICTGTGTGTSKIDYQYLKVWYQ